MIFFQVFTTIIALVLILIFSINKFSKQIEVIAGKRFKILLGKLTHNPIIGTITGTAVTSVIQSSAATTVMTVSLVNAGIITFYQSLGVVFGSNIGTTITYQLVAFNVDKIAPLIIIFGFLILKLGKKYSIYGKPIFYFGLIFFCISLITQTVKPLAGNTAILHTLSMIDTLPMAILAGIIVTTVFQSSSVMGGLILSLAGSGFITLSQGIGLMLGSNIGSTSTALLASTSMDVEAKKTTLAHFLFNFIGVIIVYPFLPFFIQTVTNLGGNITHHIANMHLIFNVFSTIVFLLFIRRFFLIIEWISKLKIFQRYYKKANRKSMIE
jgi:phosphate:Na+ symporter